MGEKLPVVKIEGDLSGDLKTKRVATATHIEEFGPKPGDSAKAEINPGYFFDIYNLDSLKKFSEKQELEEKKSYEFSLDRAIEALKDTKGIVGLKNRDVPTIVVSDLHARRDFLVNALSQKDEEGSTVLDLLKEGKINMICLGDGMHSEKSSNWDVFDPNPTKGEGFRELNPKKLEKEMIASLGLMKIIMELKANFPDSFHYVRGNHDDIVGNVSGFMKYVPEEFGGESGIVKWWTKNHFGLDFLNKWAEFESRLPLVVKGKGFVASHTVPEEQLAIQQINDRDKKALWQMLWTDNTEFFDLLPNPQQIFEGNLKNLGASNSTWIIGHRPVPQRKYRRQFHDQLIQINSSQKQLVAIFSPDEIFNPEKNIFDLRTEKATGLGVAGNPYAEPGGEPSFFSRVKTGSQKGILDTIRSSDAFIRAKAIRSAGEMKDPIFVLDIINALKDENPNVRFGAAWALGSIGDPQAVEPLIAALKDSDETVRYRAAEALGGLKDPRAVRSLEEITKDSGEGVAQVAIAWWALKQINEGESAKSTETVIPDYEVGVAEPVAEMAEAGAAEADKPKIEFSPEQQKVLSILNVKMKVYADRIKNLYDQRGESEHLSETVLAGILEEQSSRMFAAMRDRGIFKAEERKIIIGQLLGKNS